MMFYRNDNCIEDGNHADICVFKIDNFAKSENTMSPEEKTDFIRMQDSLETVKDDIKVIKTALLGDQYGNAGMVNEIKELKQKIQILESFKNRIIWIAMGISMVFGLGYNILKDWIK